MRGRAAAHGRAARPLPAPRDRAPLCPGCRPAFRRKHMRMHVRSLPPHDRLTLAFASIRGETAYARDWRGALGAVERAELAADQATSAAPIYRPAAD